MILRTVMAMFFLWEALWAFIGINTISDWNRMDFVDQNLLGQPSLLSLLEPVIVCMTLPLLLLAVLAWIIGPHLKRLP